MRKEQAIKHEYVIKWWLENTDKGVWMNTKYDQVGWMLTDQPDWHECLTYVQNDEYAELRMAQADGKVIQIRTFSDREWVDGQTKSFSLSHECYRIKPDEPKFKKGDWVRSLKEPYNTLIARDFECMHVEGNFELWELREGDEVIVLNHMMPHISQVTYVNNELCVTSFKNGYDRTCDVRAIPYVGQPLKDIK